jgi:hypothetical protein
LVAIPDFGRVTWAVTLAVAGAPEESTASVFQTEAVRTPEPGWSALSRGLGL